MAGDKRLPRPPSLAVPRLPPPEGFGPEPRVKEPLSTAKMGPGVHGQRPAQSCRPLSWGPSPVPLTEQGSDGKQKLRELCFSSQEWKGCRFSVCLRDLGVSV